MTEPVWAIMYGYGYEPIEVIRETDKTVFYRCRGSERRTQSALPWRGVEADARKLSEQLRSASAEKYRRIREADVWFAKRVEELTGGQIND